MAKLITVTSLLLILSSSWAGASTLEYWYDIFGITADPTHAILVSSATPVGGGTTSTLSINRFDQTGSSPTQQRVLTDVGLFVNWIATGNVVVGSFNVGTFNFSSAHSDVTIGLTGPLPTSPTTLQIPTTALAGANSLTCTLGPCQQSYATTPTSGTNENHVGINNLGYYEGFTPTAMTFNTSTSDGSFGGSTSSQLLFGGNASVGGILHVVYTFDTITVPEPVTFATLGTALIGLSVLLRRLRKKQS